MSRWFIRAASIAMMVAGSGLTSIQAQEDGPFELPSPDANPLLIPGPAGNPSIPLLAAAPSMQPVADPVAGGVMAAAMPQQGGYVNLHAPMYPTPRPNIPIWSGGTMITNQALAPHEMLYPHTYRAMYPPFYHRVHGGYVWTPFGMRSHEKWDLLGTTVKVKYRSHWPVLGMHPPVTSQWGGPWK